MNITAPTKEELKQKIDKLRADQKIKNLEFKQDLRTKKIEGEILNSPIARFNHMKRDKVMENILNMKIEYIAEPKIYLSKNTGNTACILASSKAGKSYLLINLLNKYFSDKDQISTLFSINSNCRAYKKLDKKILRCNTFNNECEDLIQNEQRANNMVNNKYKFINVFDDVLSVKSSKLIRELILTYRNANLSSILVLQYPFLLDKCLRANVNNIYLGKFNSNEIIEDIVKIYCKPFFRKILGYAATLDDMCAFYNKITSDYGFIHIVPQKNEISYIRLK